MVRLCAAALALLMLAACGPRSAAEPTAAPQPTAPIQPSRTATAAPAPAASPTPRPTATSLPTHTPSATPAPAEPAYSYPIGAPGRTPGDGFVIRHGAGAENTWYSRGNWHTGEDWYAQEGDTAGACVYSAAAGEVVYAGANYPGRVVIVRHDDGLLAMYGHLDPRLPVAEGQRVARGQPLGTVLARTDGRAPSHLHFEIRTFLTAPEVNGAAPRYGFRCGANCPPGPGYWPIGAPDLPGDLGWTTPTHAIARRALAGVAQQQLGAVVVATRPVSTSATLWSEPPSGAARTLGELALRPGARLALLEVWAGEERPRETSAHAYQLWYHVRAADGAAGWVQAAVALPIETGSDGRPSAVGLNLLPDAPAGADCGAG